MLTEEMSRGERSKQNILEAAYQLFLEQGYHATSMRQIAEQSGIALGGIYNHFPGKEAIFGELIIEKHPFNQILPHLIDAPGSNIDVFVENAAQSMIAELGRRPDFIKLMFIEIVEFNGRNMPRLMDVILPKILPLISRFTDSGNEVRAIPPFILFRAFLGLFFSYYMTELLLENTPAVQDQRDALNYFVEIFLHGVLQAKEGA